LPGAGGVTGGVAGGVEETSGPVSAFGRIGFAALILKGLVDIERTFDVSLVSHVESRVYE
jgi:hypothetical protein